MTATTIQSSKDDTHIYYEKDDGRKNKNTLVLLHGLGGDLTAWNTERRILNKIGYSIIAIDLRGHGLSGRPSLKEHYDISYFMQDILDILEAENIKNYVLVGHCFGGMVALALEAFYPGLSQGLILIDTSYKSPFLSTLNANPEFLKKILSFLSSIAPEIRKNEHVHFDQKFVGTSDFSIRRIASDIMHTSLKSYLLICENILSFNSYDLLSAIEVPTLIIAGSVDHIIPLSIQKQLKKRITHSELKVMDGNHILIINNPHEVTETLTQFLSKLAVQ